MKEMENWKNLMHLFVTVFLSNFTTYIVMPTIVDVTMEAVCPGKDECSLAIYLTGFQQAITGLGAVVMMPLIGNLSDAYGRKTLLLIPLTLSIFPPATLTWERTTTFFYTYYAFKILTAMVTDGGVICLALAYLADNVGEDKRVSAFGVLSGVVSAANVCGTLAARLLSTTQILQVATTVSVVAVTYACLLLKETSHYDRADELMHQPILKTQTEENNRAACCLESSNKKINVITRIPSPKDIINLLTSSFSFSLLVCIAFFNSLAEAGIQSFLLYYLKAQFHFKKNQFADILLITYFGATVSSMVFVPVLSPFIGEEMLLNIGLFAGFLNVFLNSTAWSAWVPYASASLGFIFPVVTPSLRSMVSKQTGPNAQGIAQGCILGITSLAYLVSPIIFGPLSALFLSEDAPFRFPGFGIFCIGLAYLIGFILSIFIKRHIKSRNSL